MKQSSGLSRFFSLSDEGWRRHANPWSVWTRFAAIPAMILAIWSRAWIGWWALVPVAVVVLWLVVNPFAFAPVTSPDGWASRGIYGEKLWLTGGPRVPAGYRAVLRWLISLGALGFALLAAGLWFLDVWATVYGATLIVVAQLWRIDRMGLLYQEVEAARPSGETAGGDPP